LTTNNVALPPPYVDIHTHRDDRVVILCGGRELPCRGIHPWKAGGQVAEYSLDGVAAIGEIGLDYACKVDRQLQKDVFERQLALAQSHGLPVVVHCVRAMDDALAILAGYRLRAVIFHGFTGNPQVARGALQRGYYLSFGPVAFRSPKTLDTLRAAPRSQIFLETDTSGEDIESVYARAAEVLGTGGGAQTEAQVAALREQIYDNFKLIFG